MTAKPLGDTLLPIVQSVQRILTERASQPRTVVPAPKAPVGYAAADGVDLAQRVADRFLAQQGDRLQRGISPGEISEALLALLLEEDASLGRPKSRDGRLRELQSAVRQTSHRLGAAMQALDQSVRLLGFGYRPSLIELRAELTTLLAELGEGMTAAKAAEALARLAGAGQLPRWKAAMFSALLRRRRAGHLGSPSDEELELLLADEQALAELRKACDGPWDAYLAQAAALIAHRNVGRALVALEEETTAVRSRG